MLQFPVIRSILSVVLFDLSWEVRKLKVICFCGEGIRQPWLALCLMQQYSMRLMNSGNISCILKIPSKCLDTIEIYSNEQPSLTFYWCNSVMFLKPPIMLSISFIVLTFSFLQAFASSQALYCWFSGGCNRVLLYLSSWSCKSTNGCYPVLHVCNFLSRSWTLVSICMYACWKIANNFSLQVQQLVTGVY